jgi:competence protein ComEA
MPGSPPEPGEEPLVPVGGGPYRPDAPPPADFGSVLAERFATWRREPRLLTVALVVVVLAAGAWWVRLSTGESSAALPRTGAQSASSTTTPYRAPSTSLATTSTTNGVFVVDVVGAVRHPGVVSLPGSARVVDAVNAAGGALADADLDRINLAAHLVDGMRIAVPRRGQPSDAAGPTADPGAAATDPGAASGTPTPSAPVDLNTATESQLETLPGIGPSLGAAIILERQHEGGFHSVDDLRRVRGIGDVRFAQLRPLVTV